MIISTMQRLAAENARMRRTGTIDRIVCWVCIAAVLGFQIYKIFGGHP